MEIEKHLEEHEIALRSLAKGYGKKGELKRDCYLAGVLVLIELHEGPYRHEAELLTYGWLKVHEAMLKQKQMGKEEHHYGVKEDLDTLQAIALEQGRGRLYLEQLYDSPIPGLKSVPEQSLSPDRVELAHKLMANLSDEDLVLLDLSYDHSDYSAAEVLGIPRKTYTYRRDRAIRRAKKLASTLR